MLPIGWWISYVERGVVEWCFREWWVTLCNSRMDADGWCDWCGEPRCICDEEDKREAALALEAELAELDRQEAELAEHDRLMEQGVQGEQEGAPTTGAAAAAPLTSGWVGSQVIGGCCGQSLQVAGVPNQATVAVSGGDSALQVAREQACIIFVAALIRIIGQHASTQEDKARLAVRRLRDGSWEFRYYSALVELMGRDRPMQAPQDSCGAEEEELEVALSMATLTLDAQAAGAGAAGSDGEVETGDIELAELDMMALCSDSY